MRIDHPAAQGSTITRERLLVGDLTGGAGRIDRVEIHQITLPPGQAARHTHPGGVAGYVISGPDRLRVGWPPVQELRAGSAFFESAGATSVVLTMHRPASRRPSSLASWSPVTSH